MPSAQLIARDELLAEVSSVLDDPPARLLLIGEPGIGKTAVWAAAMNARAADWSWSTQCLEVEAELGLGVLADLFRAVPDDVVAGLPGAQRRAVDLVLFRNDDEPQGDYADARLLGATTLGVLQAVAEHGPALIGIDDLHWCDPPSLSALTFALRRLDGAITAFATSRTRQAPELPGWRSLAVPRLPDEAIRQLTRRFGRRAAIERFEERVEEIVRTSDGNPLFANALARHAVREPDSQRLPQSLLRAVERRLDALDPRFWEALLEIAIRGSAALSDLGEQVRAHIQTSDLLVMDRGRLTFAHPLFSAAVRDVASPEQLRAAHRHAAALATDPVTRTLHRLQADADDPCLDDELDPAVRLAWSRGDIEGARHLARVAAGRPSPDTVRTERLARLAELERISGDPVRSAAVAEELHAIASTAHDRATALEKMASANADDKVAIDLLERAAAVAGLSATDRDALQRTTANRLFRAGRIAAAAATIGDVDLAAQPGVAAFGQLLIRVSGGRADLAVVNRAVAIERAQLDAQGGGEALAHATAGMLAVYDDRHEHAADLLRRAGSYEAYRGRHSVGSYFLGLLDVRIGRLDHAVDVLAEASALDGPNALGQARIALAHAWRGEREPFREALRLAREWIASDTDRALGEVLFAEGLDALFRGQSTEAFATLAVAADHLDHIGYREPGHPAVLPAAVEAAAAVQEHERAEQWCARLEHDSATTGSRFGAAASAAAQGHLARAAGDYARAEGLYDEAFGRFEEIGLPLEAARVQLTLGAMLRRVGERRRARGVLQAAGMTFARFGATGLAATADAEMRSVSGRTAADSAELTATERRVAELVATGLSNTDVARAMQVSPKTVETHLAHAFRKLDVHNRTELSRRLSSPPEGR
jgi:DNA-binding CsgD family transcriptional regulator/tetratricopeptide (TPR) repeat protein